MLCYVVQWICCCCCARVSHERIYSVAGPKEEVYLLDCAGRLSDRFDYHPLSVPTLKYIYKLVACGYFLLIFCLNIVKTRLQITKNHNFLSNECLLLSKQNQKSYVPRMIEFVVAFDSF